jgi:ribosomal protein S18 acetylase RimI-like enzyme
VEPTGLCQLGLAGPGSIDYASAMVDVVIRRAEKRDLNQLGKLGALLVEAHHQFDEQRFFAAEAGVEQGYAWFLGTQLDNPDAVLFVAQAGADGANIVGYVYAAIEARSWKELRDRAGFIHDLMVASDARSQGIGQRLFEAARGWLGEQGVPRLMLWTAARNPGAQRLFERLGFRRTMIEMTRDL